MTRFHYRLLGVILATGLAMQQASAARLRWANDGDINAMDPMTRQETVQWSFLSNIYEPLFRRDRNLALEPALAERWERISPTVWRFHLRRGVKWQDGTPFTAGDVVFSLQRVLSPSSAMRAPMAAVKAAREIEDHTVDFETHVPDPIFLQEQANFLIMSKAWCEANQSVAPALLGKSENHALRNAMGTGPFRLVSREPDHKTVVERNQGWWDKPVHNLDRVEFNVISSSATRVAALLSGEIDMDYAVSPRDVPRLRQTPGLKVLQTPELRTMYVGFNLTRDELPSSDVKGRNPFRDERVRRAVALAIDEPAIAERVMFKLARPAGMMWGPGVNGYDPARDKPMTVDIARAKLLLAEAGLPNGFRVTLDCPNDRYVMDEQICGAITAMLARVGITVELNAQTKGRFFTKVMGPRYDTDFWFLGFTPTTYDAHNVMYSLLGTRDGKRGEGNLGGYANPVLDDLIARIGTEIDPVKRDSMIGQSADILHQDLPVVPLHQQVVIWAVRSNVDVAQMADNFFPYRYVNVK